MELYYIIFNYIVFITQMFGIYLFSSKILNGNKFKTYFIFCGITALCEIFMIIFFPSNIIPKDILFSISRIFTPLLIGNIKKRKLLFLSITNMLIAIFIDCFFSLFINIINSQVNDLVIDITGFVSEILVAIIFVLVSTVLRNKTKKFIDSLSVFNIILCDISLFVGGLLNFFGMVISVSIDYRIIYLKIFVLIFSTLLALIFPLLLYNQTLKSHYNYQNRIYENQLKLQMEYYQSIVNSSYELRKIRHDYNNLSTGLKEYISPDNVELTELINKYDNRIINSLNILYNSGCDIIDALLTDKQDKNENINIKFSGNLKNVTLDKLDLFIIFNNTLEIALQNIIGNNPYINIQGVYAGGFLYCNFSFPTLNSNLKNIVNCHLYSDIENTINNHNGNINNKMENLCCEFEYKIMN